MASLAASIHDHPSRQTAVIGVTGTNGKTTVTFLLEAIARHAGRSCGLIGTVVTRLGDVYFENPRTTPEATDLQRLFRRMVDGGAEIVSCEVSSHALALGRADETRFAVGAFTNLSQDHLDFHGGMEEYFRAKARLLEMANEKVVWVEDPFGLRLAETHPTALRVGWNHGVTARQIEGDSRGTDFQLLLPSGTAPARLQLPGRFNLANALIAAGCAYLLGLTVDEIAAGLGALSSVPGRFEVIAQDPVTVVVDYAHTPEGIDTVIETARTLASGRVIVTFGAGGGRDRGKRPQMGRAASAADLVIVTTDNPRFEDPEAIIAEVMAGVDHPAAIAVVDRREAIATALDSARPGDIVLILGKGHETTQEANGILRPFSDQRIVRSLLRPGLKDRAGNQ
jgi:UDP-N-acetylmuramoyl-L-alanyl-D-glutamate--2,6-diaminopimelate ligase